MAKNKQTALVTIKTPYKSSFYMKLSGKWVLINSRSSKSTLDKVLKKGYKIIFV